MTAVMNGAGVQASSRLLVDIGNSRLKWCSVRSGLDKPRSLAQTVMSDAFAALSDVRSVSSKACSGPDSGPDVHALLSEMTQRIEQLSATAPVASLVIARVGPPEWLAVFESFAQQHGVRLQIVNSLAQHGRLRSAYDVPGSLGVDRFLGALAIAHSFSGRAAVIVSAGTATTVDALDADGCFLGGCILPGPEMMAASLHRNTALLPQASLQFAEFPRNTEAAIASGIIQAQAGAVQGVWTSLRQRAGEDPLIILAGGARAWLKSRFQQAIEVDHLVLQGLALWQDVGNSVP